MSELVDPRRVEADRIFNDNFKWFMDHYEEVKKDHLDSFVAIDNNAVVDSDKDVENLIRRLRETYGDDIRRIFIQYLTEKDYPRA